MTPRDPNQPADPWSHVITLAAGLAHEIKNPLSTINLNLQLLAEDWREAESPREKRTQKRLATLQRETTRLSALLDDFLRYARTQVVQTEAVDLNQILLETVEFITPRAAQKGIGVRTDLASDVPGLAADPKLLKQAILNLVLNAVQAMPDGGELILQTACEGENVRIEVTDTGQGILDHHLPKIFNIYFSTKQDGSGLGLPTARRIVELHHGSIRVESEPRKGTRFTVLLPVQPPRDEEGDSPQTSEGSPEAEDRS